MAGPRGTMGGGSYRREGCIGVGMILGGVLGEEDRFTFWLMTREDGGGGWGGFVGEVRGGVQWFEGGGVETTGEGEGSGGEAA